MSDKANLPKEAANELSQADSPLLPPNSRLSTIPFDIYDTLDEVVWGRTLERYTYISPAYERVWGQSAAALLENPRAFWSVVHPEDRDRVEQLEAQWLQGHLPQLDLEYRVIRPDGETRWVWLKSSAFLVAEGESRASGWVVDITAQKQRELTLQSTRANLEYQLEHHTHDLQKQIAEFQQTQQALRKSELQLELAISGSNGGLWVIDFNSAEFEPSIPDQVYLSPRLKSFIGYKDEEFPNSITAWKKRIPPQDRVKLDQSAAAYLAGQTDEYR
ncbi:MAG: PAS domain-containing protein, partial [Anaerolineae bacterium]|nr:PAS domain-containing protein [Anaerolineae bacterium]